MTLWSSKSCCVIGFCHFVIKVIYMFLHAQLLELARLIPIKLPDSSPGAQLWLFVSYFHRFHLLGTKSDKESVKSTATIETKVAKSEPPARGRDKGLTYMTFFSALI